MKQFAIAGGIGLAVIASFTIPVKLACIGIAFLWNLIPW